MSTNLNASFPPRTSRRIVRRRILKDLAREAVRRLTCLVAPAGYGKTSVAAQRLERLLAENLRAHWLSISAQDADPAQFLISMLAALEPSHGARGDLGSLSVSVLTNMLQARIRALRAPLVLFLDDYHLAQSPVADAVIAELLGHPAYQNLRLVLISRTPPRLPLSALRLADELRQIGLADLQFTRNEALDFLGEAASGLSVEQVETVLHRAEGWPVALQMVRVLARESSGGANRASSALDLSVRDVDMGRFLSEQVVSSLPPDLRQMLLNTAVLPELSAELVVAVTGETAHTICSTNWAIMPCPWRLWMRPAIGCACIRFFANFWPKPVCAMALTRPRCCAGPCNGSRIMGISTVLWHMRR